MSHTPTHAAKSALAIVLVLVLPIASTWAGPQDIPPPAAYVPPDPTSTATKLFNRTELGVGVGAALYDTEASKGRDPTGAALFSLSSA